MPKFARRLFITAIVVVQLCLLTPNGGFASFHMSEPLF